MANPFKGFLFAILLSFTVLCGSLVFLLPALVLYPISIMFIYAHRYASYVLASWSIFIAGILELIFGIKIIISGDINKIINKRQPTVIILNHRTRFDPVYMFCFLIRLGTLTQHRFIVQGDFKHIPGYGWLMQMCQYIFMQKEDKTYLKDSLRYYCDAKIPVQLLIFPEGEQFTESTLMKDNANAWKNDLPLNKYVLYPKSEIFTQCLQTLRQSWYLGTFWKEGKVDVCNVTIGYVGDIPEGMPQQILGQWPKEVHFHVTHYPSSTLPSSDEELSEWLNKRWREKEEMLTQFYKTSSFPGQVFKDSWTIKAIMVAILLKWFILCGAVIYGLLQAPVLMSVMLGIPLVIHVFVDYWMDGWDKIALRKWKESKKNI